jgi:hypothetical protein
MNHTTREGTSMLEQSESKAQTWRAVVVLEGRGECLLFVGRSSTQVRDQYAAAFEEVLDDEEKLLATNIRMEQWQGTPDAGRWIQKNELRVPFGAKSSKRVAVAA